MQSRVFAEDSSLVVEENSFVVEGSSFVAVSVAVAVVAVAVAVGVSRRRQDLRIVTVATVPGGCVGKGLEVRSDAGFSHAGFAPRSNSSQLVLRKRAPTSRRTEIHKVWQTHTRLTSKAARRALSDASRVIRRVARYQTRRAR